MIYLIGTGVMAKEYVKVLLAMGVDFKVIGNSEKTCKSFESETGVSVIPGGDKALAKLIFSLKDKFIVAVPVEALATTIAVALNKGAFNILAEKPVGLSLKTIQDLKDMALTINAKIYVAYNRRFYSSVIEAKKIIKKDGGVQSVFFDFTEWSDQIGNLKKAEITLRRWVLSNSSHILDLAFYLAGKPKKMATYRSGSLNWHEHSTFSGCGITENNVLFNYMANWDSAGRWRLELHTRKRKIIFTPIEQLHVMNRGSTIIDKVNLPDVLDTSFKPGIYLQVHEFIYKNDSCGLCTIDEHLDLIASYERIAGYSA